MRFQVTTSAIEPAQRRAWLVGQEREGGDLPRPVARRAARKEDRRDVLGIGHRYAGGEGQSCGHFWTRGGSPSRPRLGGGTASGRSSVGPCARWGSRRRWSVRRDRAAGQHGLDRVGEVMMGGLVVARPQTVLVIDRPSVTEPASAVDHEGLASSLDQELRRQLYCPCPSRRERWPATAAHAPRHRPASRCRWN